jgi:hypothetical protein
LFFELGGFLNLSVFLELDVFVIWMIFDLCVGLFLNSFLTGRLNLALGGFRIGRLADLGGSLIWAAFGIERFFQLGAFLIELFFERRDIVVLELGLETE